MFKKEIRTYEPQEPTLIQLFGRCVIATRRAERSSGTPEYEAAHEAALVSTRAFTNRYAKAPAFEKHVADIAVGLTKNPMSDFEQDSTIGQAVSSNIASVKNA